MIFRHNGIPIPLFLCLCLMLVYRHQWKKLFTGLLIALGIYFVITGPVYSANNVRKVSDDLGNTILLHHIGAHIQAKTPITDEDQQFLNTLMPLNQWQYDCCCVNSLYYPTDFNRTVFSENKTRIQEIFLSTLLKNPMVNIMHITCSSSVIYSVHPTCYNYISPLVIESGKVHWITDPMIVSENSLIPSLEGNLFYYFLNSFQPGWFSFFWRPALALLIGMLFLWLIILKERSVLWAILGIPLFLQSIIMFLINLAPDFRYFYSTGLITFFIVSVFIWTFFMKKDGLSN